MSTLASVLVAVVAVQHLLFLVLEMFLWSTPFGLRVFRQTQAQADTSRVLAANQGLYNGFLAAGLAWSLLARGNEGRPIALFFLTCVVVAGVFGAATVRWTLLVVQALPAAVALACVLAS